MTVKAKKKKPTKKDKSVAISEKMVRAAMADEAAKADKRFKYAKKIIEHNGEAFAEMVEKMVVILGRGVQERLIIKGVAVECDYDELHEINRKTRTWVAVRLLVAAAEWDIRIGNIKLPKSRCFRCGKKVK